ncbi:hypothetical protein GALMADRAFT_255863 [Galerina marginata CBS 339.88]|uniref:Cytochrome P450 n=1 Tax=Galerina marginata (strain CBS 339.88) TaxID=685588 RepID=A0A067SI47_GALM3|nr:hypothetical protein GALMADRAFT_255863 [Galerina marginata CBS 339.88]
MMSFSAPFICSCIGTMAVVGLIRWYYSVTTRLQGIPGPPLRSTIVGNLEELSRAPMGTKMNVWARKYGQTYKIRGALMEPWLILGDPRGAGYVLQGKNYVRPESDRLFLELFFGKSLFCAEGDEYRKMRKYLNPAFTLQSVQDVSHILFELADNLKRQWDETLDGREVAVFDIAPKIHMLSLDAISMTMFMHNLSASKGKIPALLHQMSNSPAGDFWTILLETFASLFPYILYLPSPIKKYAHTLRTEFGNIAQEVWAGKDGGGMHAKVLDALGKAQSSDGPVSKDEAIAQITSILFAGSETTANVITESLYELSRNLSIQHKLRTEIFNFRSVHERPPGFEDLMNPTTFPYLDAVIRESLRTKAVLREIGRMALHDDVIPLQFPIYGSTRREVHVKAGQIIQIPIRDGINADESIWGPDVDEFRPERWIEPDGLPSSVDFIHAQGRTLSFGDGPKACLGRIFALAEIKIVVSTIISQFSLENSGAILDFYHLGGNTVKPVIRGREAEGVQLPVQVRTL